MPSRWRSSVQDGMRNAQFVITSKHVGRHQCQLPRWRERHRHGIAPGDRCICLGCNQEWEWNYRPYEDSGKEWRRV